MFYMNATSRIDKGQDDKLFQSYDVTMIGNKSTMYYAIMMLGKRAMLPVTNEWMLQQLHRMDNILTYDSVFLHGYKAKHYTVRFDADAPGGPRLNLITHEPIELHNCDLQEYPVINEIAVAYNDRTMSVNTLRGDELNRDWALTMMAHIIQTHHHGHHYPDAPGPRKIDSEEFFTTNKPGEIKIPGKGLIKQINNGGTRRRYEYYPDNT